MKNKIRFFALLMGLFLIVGCSTGELNSSSSTKVECVILKFVQHSYIKEAQDEGYYFENDQLITTEMTFQKGSYLDVNLINSFYEKINYIVPELNGDGYWSFTFFTKDFNENTGLTTNFLSEQILDEDIIIHFAIYG